jgi:hypothetical protein
VDLRINYADRAAFVPREEPDGIVACFLSRSKCEERVMAKKQTVRGRKQDRARVAGAQSYEVRYEAKKTGKSKAAVKKAVKKVGNSRRRVEKRLGAIGR